MIKLNLKCKNVTDNRDEPRFSNEIADTTTKA